LNQADFSTSNRKRLDAFLAADHPAGSVAVFDLDGTLVHNDTGEALFHRLARRGELEFDTLLNSPAIWQPFADHPDIPSPRRAITGFLQDPDALPELNESLIRAYRLLVRCAGKQVAYPWATYLLAGKTEDRVRQLSREVLRDEMDADLDRSFLSGGACDERVIEVHHGLRPYQAMNRLVQDVQAVGIQPWIVTASNRWTAEVYAEMVLELPREQVIGMSARIQDGRILGEPDPHQPITFGDGKVEAIRRLIGKIPVLAAGDSLNQCDMMCLASGLRLVIHKGDNELLQRVASFRAAGQDNWLVQPRFIDPPDESQD